MPNRTEGVKTLVEEVLATLPTPYSEDVIDEVFLAIEANPTWLTVYNVLCNDLRRYGREPSGGVVDFKSRGAHRRPSGSRPE